MPSHFPHVGFQVLSALIYFFGLSILAHCLSRRIQSNWTWPLRDISWPRFCVLLIFLDSWLFVFSSGVLVFGVGLETITTACTAAISICIAFYASSKVLVYAFLVEKVHLVWSPTAQVGRRLRSPVYLICMATMSVYVAAVILMIIGAVHFWREDGLCVIGLKTYASIPLLVFDLYLTIFLNGLFLWPLFRSKISNPRVRAVAVRTLVASLAALITSTVNIGVLTFQHGRQLGWVCLGSCGTDVVLNALAVFWVTTGSDSTMSTAGQHDTVTDGSPEISQSHTLDPPGQSGSNNSKANKFSFTSSAPPVAAKSFGRFQLNRSKESRAESHMLQVMVTTRKSIEVDDLESDRLSDNKDV